MRLWVRRPKAAGDAPAALGDGWEVAGTTCHVSLARAEGTVKWLRSQENMASWEFAAATLADGTHRVLRRRTDGRAGGPGDAGHARTPARTPQLTR